AIDERLGGLAVGGKRGAIARLGPFGCAERLVAEAQVVEQVGVTRSARERPLVVDHRGAIFRVREIAVSEVERGLGVVRIDLESAPPGVARCTGVGRLEALAKKVPGGNVAGVDLEGAAGELERGGAATGAEGDLCLAQQRI